MRKKLGIVSRSCPYCGRDMRCLWCERNLREIDEGELGKVCLSGTFKPLDETLLDYAKGNPAVRPLFLEVLLTKRRGSLDPEPEIADRDLVTAIRVVYRFWTDPDWNEVRKLLLRFLAEKQYFRISLTSNALARCQYVLGTLGRHYGIDITLLNRRLEALKKPWGRNLPRKRKRRAGRPFDETSQRIVASVHFLKRCGEKLPELKVSMILADLRIMNLDPQSIRRKVNRFKSSVGPRWYSHPLDDLLKCWLTALSNDLRLAIWECGNTRRAPRRTSDVR
jgi:hypothetical protein